MEIQIKAKLGHSRLGRVSGTVTDKLGKGVLVEIKDSKRSKALKGEPDVSYRGSTL